MKIALTPKWIDGKDCTNGAKPCVDFFDLLTPGLCLRVTSGKKSWGLVYTPPGGISRTRMALGAYLGDGLGMTLLQARTAALEAKALVDKGTDPRMVADKVPDKTIAELVEDYLQYALAPKGKPPLRTTDEIMRRLRKEVVPFVGKIAVKNFDVSHMTEVMDRMEDRECFVLANRVFSDVKRMLKFAVRRGLIKYSPLAELEPPHDEASGTRFLSLDEIRHFWHQSPKGLIRSPKVQMILRAILATSKRSNEVCGALRSEIDWGKRLWTIPKERVKGREKSAMAEVVPLSDLAFMIFEEAARRSNTDYLFPNDDNDGPYQPGVVAHCVRMALEPTDALPLGRLGMVKFTPHDLRRTVGTQMLNKANGLGITKDQKYLALNHLSEINKNVSDKVYDMNDYADDKRFALDAWGAFLAALVGVETGLRVAA